MILLLDVNEVHFYNTVLHEALEFFSLDKLDLLTCQAPKDAGPRAKVVYNRPKHLCI